MFSFSFFNQIMFFVKILKKVDYITTIQKKKIDEKGVNLGKVKIQTRIGLGINLILCK